jgi:hypothetical protein
MVEEGGCTEEGVDDTDTSHHSQLQAGWVIDHCQPPYACETTATQSFCSYVIQGAYYLGGGRLLHATADWRILCTHYSFNSGSAAPVCWQERTGPMLFARLAKGEEGGKLRKQRLRAEIESNGYARRTREARRQG